MFTPAGLGHAAGQLYAQISTCFVTVTELAPASGRSVLRDAAAVEELVLRAGGRLLAGESPSGGGFMVCCD